MCFYFGCKKDHSLILSSQSKGCWRRFCQGLVLTISLYWESKDNLYAIAAVAAAKSLQCCLTLCDPVDGSPLGSTVPGILQSRVLEWVATALVCYKIWHSINLSGSKTKYTSGMKVAVISQSVMSDVIKRIHFCKQNFCVFKEYSMRIWCPHI